jgi:hypothetical protein
MRNGNKFDNKTIRKIVEEALKHMDKPKLVDIVEIIRPYYAWNSDDLIERELKNKARAIMRTFKDHEGVRTYFSENGGVYINVENSTDLVDLDKVNKQLEKKYSGLSAALQKVRKRIAILVKKFKGITTENAPIKRIK